MFDLLLAVGFTAFFLAVFDFPIRLMTISTGAVFANTLFSLSFASIGSYLVGFDFNIKFIAVTSAVAFFGMSALKISERLVTYRPVTVNSARQ